MTPELPDYDNEEDETDTSPNSPDEDTDLLLGEREP